MHRYSENGTRGCRCCPEKSTARGTRMSAPTTNWADVDFSKSTSALAKEIGCSVKAVQNARNRHAPETVRKYSPSGLAGSNDYKSRYAKKYREENRDRLIAASAEYYRKHRDSELRKAKIRRQNMNAMTPTQQAAAALGRLKRGKKERKSEAKAASSRENGKKGGRPKKLSD